MSLNQRELFGNLECELFLKIYIWLGVECHRHRVDHKVFNQVYLF